MEFTDSSDKYEIKSKLNTIQAFEVSLDKRFVFISGTVKASKHIPILVYDTRLKKFCGKCQYTPIFNQNRSNYFWTLSWYL